MMFDFKNKSARGVSGKHFNSSLDNWTLQFKNYFCYWLINISVFLTGQK